MMSHEHSHTLFSSFSSEAFLMDVKLASSNIIIRINAFTHHLGNHCKAFTTKYFSTLAFFCNQVLNSVLPQKKPQRIICWRQIYDQKECNKCNIAEKNW